MGRRAFFTREQVYEAANTLASQGEDVTVRSLHAYLGGGSFSTVMKYWHDWKATAAPQEATAGEMPAAVSSAFEAVWRTAMAQASKELAAVEELENKVNELTEKLEEATAKLETTEGQLRQALNEKSALTAVNAQLKADLQKAETAREKLQADNDKLTKRHGEELAALQKQHAEETNKLQVAMAKLETARDAAQEQAAKNQERVKKLTEEAKEEAAKLENKLDSALQERDKAVKAAAELEGTVKALKGHNQELLARVGPAQKKRE